MNKIKAYKGNDPYIFLSYSHQDTEVQTIVEDLAEKNYRIWYDEGIKSGCDWADEITDRIKNCSQFIVILSKNAIESENVKDEIHIAIKYKIDILAIHLEKINLQGGLELHLDRKQALLKYDFTTNSEFEDKLYCAIKTETIEPFENSEQTAKNELESQYELITLVAKDSAKTYLAKKKNGHSFFLVKQFLSDNESAWAELSALRAAQDCPYILSLVDYFFDSKNFYIVTPLINGSELSKIIEEIDYNKIVDYNAHQNFCVDIIKCIANGLSYLSKCNPPIVHRGIKPGNIMVTSNSEAYIKDLDIAVEVDNRSHTSIGYVGYAAPEAYLGKEDCRSDIFSLGITFLELLTGCNPQDDRMFDIRRPLRSYNKNLNPVLEHIIEKMIDRDINKRYQNIEQVIFDFSDLFYSNKRFNKIYDMESSKRIKKFEKERRQSYKHFLSQISDLKTVDKQGVPLLCNAKNSGEIFIKNDQSGVDKATKESKLPQEQFVIFYPEYPVRFDQELTVEFELSHAVNINTLWVNYSNKHGKPISVDKWDNNKIYRVVLSDYPTQLEAVKHPERAKMDRIMFSCSDSDIENESVDASVTISNVYIRKN